MSNIFDNDMFMNILMVLAFILVIAAIIAIMKIMKGKTTSNSLGWKSLNSDIGTQLLK